MKGIKEVFSMKKRVVALLAASLIAVSSLTGCGATTESVVNGMFSEKVLSSSNESSYDVGVEVNYQGAGLKFGLNGDFDYQYELKSEDDMVGHAVLTANLEMPEFLMGFLPLTDFMGELYTEKDGGELVQYVSDQKSKTWKKNKADSITIDTENVKKIVEAYKKVLLEKAELQDKTEEVDGETCYVLDVEMSGDDLSEVLGIVYDIAKEPLEDRMANASSSGANYFRVNKPVPDKADFLEMASYAVIKMKLYVSKKTGCLVRSEVDCGDTDLGAMIFSSLERSGTDISYLGSFDADDIKITKFTLSTAHRDVGSTTVKIPDEVKENAE
jgi:hypothetical protein